MFNAEKLLAPIEGADNPCGTELIFATEIDLITEARREEDPTLDQGEWVTDVKVAAWPTVIDLCSKLLSEQSKDLRFAVWLTEAGTKVHAFAGLNEGYQLILGLVEQYWDDFYPNVDDEDGFEQRVGNLSWVLSRSVDLVKNLPLTEGKNSAYSSIDIEVARKNSNMLSAAEDGELPDDLLTSAVVESARKQSSKDFYQKLLNDVEACQDTVEALEKAVDEKLGLDGPGFASCKEAISNILTLVKRFAQEAGVLENNTAQPVEANQEDDAVQQPANQNQTIHAEYINNREQALTQLRNVADFFRRTEPHSPVAYLADKAANWGDMPLHQWLSTVIKDQGSLAHVEELLGLASNKPEDEPES